MYYDERGYIITEDQLKASYTELKVNGETDVETYEAYVRECCGKNGTLKEIEN